MASPVKASELARLHINPVTLASRNAPQAPQSSAHAEMHAGVQPLSAFVPLEENAFVYVPPQCVGRRHVSLVVLLHGAQMNGLSMLTVDDNILQMAADWFGFILVAPKSTRSTWQLALGQQADRTAEGMDRRRIDDAVRQVMQHYDIDPTRIALAGVSDGATTALFLGYANGDIFSRVIAWSQGMEPGDLAAFIRRGAPPMFIAHGDQDEVLPISHTRALVPWLRRAGYRVTYAEDHDHHYLTKERAVAAFQWLAGSWPHPGPEDQCGE